MVVSERVTLNILSDSDFNQGGIFGGSDSGPTLPSSIIKKQRKATTSRQADSALAAIEKAKDKKSSAAVVKASEFTKLQNQVNANEKVLSLFSRGQGFISGAAGLSTPGGILSTASGLASRIPGAIIVIGAAKIVAEKYIGQFGAGGTRDTRVQIQDEDLSDIGIANETAIDSGRKLFLSNPLKNQGLPTGNSNTQNIRDGIRIYNLRQEGSYQ
jgi:hypothetical protein